MLPCLTLSIIRYGSVVKWNNPGKGVMPSSTPWCSSYWKGSLRVALNYNRHLYLLYLLYIHKTFVNNFYKYLKLYTKLRKNFIILTKNICLGSDSATSRSTPHCLVMVVQWFGLYLSSYESFWMFSLYDFVCFGLMAYQPL